MLSPRKPIFAFFALWWGGTIPRVSLRCTLGYEPLAPLGRSTFQVVLRCGFYHGFSRKLGTDFHNIVFICALFCVNLWLFCRTAAVMSNLKGWMPRALARVLVAGGGASAQLSECRPSREKRLKYANQRVTISFSEAARWSFDEKIFEWIWTEEPEIRAKNDRNWAEKRVKHEKNEVFEIFFAKNIASSKIMRTFASVIAETNEWLPSSAGRATDS